MFHIKARLDSVKITKDGAQLELWTGSANLWLGVPTDLVPKYTALIGEHLWLDITLSPEQR